MADRRRDTLISLAITIVMLTIANLALVYFSPVVFKRSVFPRAFINQVDPCYQTLYHDTHDGSLRDWVAVLGDSYGAGSGDEFLDGEADYGIFHKLRSQTHDNYLIFARGGFGSISAVRELSQCLNLFNGAWLLPDIENPSRVLFLFYEGNDLDNNLDHLQARAATGSLEDFVAHEISTGEDDLQRRIRLLFPLYDVIWRQVAYHSRGLWKGIRNSLKKFTAEGRDAGPRAGSAGTRTNSVILAGRPHPVPELPQSASAELAGGLDRGLQLFYEAVMALQRLMPATPVTIVYLPSVVTTYSWQDPVQVQTYHTDGPVFTTTEDNDRQSRRIRQSIAEFTLTHGLGFVDTTPALQAAARTEAVHGPRDWSHFNSRGYQMVSDAIAAAAP